MELKFSVWYTILCTIAAFNVVLLLWQLHRTKKIPLGNYQKYQRILAVPWVFECSYRSVFPSLYLQRYVVWDTLFNSILVDRTLAFVGELTWTAQFALVIYHLDAQLGSRRWVQSCSYLSVMIYFVAEMMVRWWWWCLGSCCSGSVVFLPFLWLFLSPHPFPLPHFPPSSFPHFFLP